MTAVDDRPAPEIGQARKRKEDRRLITGRTRWTDNIQLPGMLHLAMVRSPFAHARITAIDTSGATSEPGVVAVFTGKDLEDSQGVNINAWPITPDQVTPTHLPVVIDHVACAGEIVAVVVARSASAARDAAEKVDVDYDELPAVLDLKEAAADTVLAHPDLGTNKSAFWKLDSAEAGTGGDVDEAIAKARVDGIVIEREYRQQRLVPAFMEPRSTVVDPTERADDRVVGHPGAAHPALRDRRDDGHPRVQGARHRPRRRWWLRRQAADHARGVRHDRRRPQARPAVQVHRDPLGVDDLRRTTAATSGRS